MMTQPAERDRPGVAVLGTTDNERRHRFVDAVESGGGSAVRVDAADGLVWLGRAADLAPVLQSAPQLRWVQLPAAGVESYMPLLAGEATFTSAKGAFALPVAEHALALTLGLLRQIGTFARRTRWSQGGGTNLVGQPVTILGGGGIARTLVDLLAPFDCDVTIVRRGVGELPGTMTVGPESLLTSCAQARVVIVALALTPETEGIVDATVLEAMSDTAYLVNVARGRHVVTEDLVSALRSQVIAGAALDVTDPEPLPAHHPLWTLPNCIITPHTADTPEMADPLLAARVRVNTARFAAGEDLVGVVDPTLGY